MSDNTHQQSPITKNEVVNVTLHIAWGVVLVPVLLLLFAYISKGVFADKFTALDYQVTESLRQIASPPLTAVVSWITHLANSYIIIPLSLVIAAWLAYGKQLKAHAMMLLVSLGGSYLLNEGLKAIFHRVRPEWEHWVQATGYSFPSGHAMVSTAFYGMLAYLLFRIMRAHDRPTWYILPTAVIMIAAIGLSRVYLGVHYFTDVLAGFIAGGVWLLACMYTLSWLCSRSSQKKSVQ